MVGIIYNPLFQIGLTYKPISGGPPVPTELLRHTFLPLSSAQRGEILSKVNLTGIYICFSDYVFSLPFELPNLKLGGNYSCQFFKQFHLVVSDDVFALCRSLMVILVLTH